MPSYRAARTSEDVMRELTAILREMKDPRIAEALSHVRYYAGGRIAVIAVTTEMVERAGVDESELEGLASKPLTIIGVDIGITLKERADGSIRVSMRSNDQADVSAVCRRFEGGGHIRAAGCRIWKPLAEAEAVLVNACLEELS